MFEESVLLLKAKKTSVDEVYREPTNTQIDLFKATLKDLDEYLDTGDLTQITSKSLEVIKNDMLGIIKGLRKIKQKTGGSPEIFSYVKSVDGILGELRFIRDIVFEVQGMFEGDKLKDDKRNSFFEKLRICREHAEKSLTMFLTNS